MRTSHLLLLAAALFALLSGCAEGSETTSSETTSTDAPQIELDPTKPDETILRINFGVGNVEWIEGRQHQPTLLVQANGTFFLNGVMIGQADEALVNSAFDELWFMLSDPETVNEVAARSLSDNDDSGSPSLRAVIDGEQVSIRFRGNLRDSNITESDSQSVDGYFSSLRHVARPGFWSEAMPEEYEPEVLLVYGDLEESRSMPDEELALLPSDFADAVRLAIEDERSTVCAELPRQDAIEVLQFGSESSSNGRSSTRGRIDIGDSRIELATVKPLPGQSC